MALTEQEKVLIYRKAQDYVQSEGNALFRKEVIDALDEHADDELYDRFYTSLAFGTAGIRGVIGGFSSEVLQSYYRHNIYNWNNHPHQQ
jgi:hypothetical protein